MWSLDSMNNAWKELREILPNVNYWRVEDAEHIAAVRDHKEPRLVSNTFLREAHPLLPQVCRALISRGYHKTIYPGGAGVLKAGGLDMLFTVHLLRATPLQLVDKTGVPRTLLYVGDASMQLGNGLVQFHCADLITEECDIDGRSVLLVKDGGWDYLYFQIAEVDAKYPGWQDRMALVQELDQNMTDATPFVFCSPSSLSTPLSLPEIEFN